MRIVLPPGVLYNAQNPPGFQVPIRSRPNSCPERTAAKIRLSVAAVASDHNSEEAARYRPEPAVRKRAWNCAGAARRRRVRSLLLRWAAAESGAGGRSLTPAGANLSNHLFASG